jgi:hypothetical protein
MTWLTCAVVLTAGFPVVVAWRANQRTTLKQSIAWAAGAWACWLLTFVALALEDFENAGLGRHLSLSLTGCAGVAVLGARRPGVQAWNFVVCGLLAVLLLPLAQRRIDPAFLIFLGATLLVGITNYLPTRAGLGALLIGVGCGLMLANVQDEAAGICLGLGPWLAWGMLRQKQQLSEGDALWLGFRDRFGVVWGQRVREQMNRACANSNWPATLTWWKLEMLEGADATKILEALRALLKRFEPE